MKTIRWGIIGCGNVTENKSGPGFQQAEHSALVAVMRRDGDLARDYAIRHQVPKWYNQASDLINDPEVDAIYIATPPAYHHVYALDAAKAGKPVYVEKPMAMNHQQCMEMINGCADAGVPLFVAYYRRALPRFLKVKALLDSHAIGDIRYMTVRYSQTCLKPEPGSSGLPWRVQPDLSGGGLFLDVGSHILDILDFLLGPIREVKGAAINQANVYPAEDLVTAQFVFASGVHGTGVWCFSAFEQQDVIEIVGSEGKIVFSTFGDEPIIMAKENEMIEFPTANPKHIQQPLIQTIVNELNGGPLCPSHGESGARTSWVMEQCIRDYYRGMD